MLCNTSFARSYLSTSLLFRNLAFMPSFVWDKENRKVRAGISNYDTVFLLGESDSRAVLFIVASLASHCLQSK